MNPQKNGEKSKMVTGTIVTIAGGILWGVSGVCGQYMFQNKGVTAPWLVSVRLVVAGLLMLCYYFLTDREQTLAIWKSKRDRRDVIIYGLLGMLPCQYAYFQTIEWSNAGTATVIQYLGPALIVIWVCFRTKRMPTLQEITGVILAVIGVFLIATHGNPTSLALSGRALLMGLASAVSVAIYTLEPARLQKKYDTPLILAWGMTIGGVALTLISRPWTAKGIQADAEMFAALAFVIVFGTMAGFSLYMTGVKLIGSVKASLYACMEPVSSMILTVLWMKVNFTTPDLIGTLLVIATIIILAIPTKKNR
ncbi:DMT family transporter [Blautia sp. HCP3S3_D9]|uniref:DMT family transporter n=1 Tax=unclassified Blautia TaxID=2648079 RepID=UPI001C0F7F5B|nr:MULTISPECIES: EamA family transporter [unclassified Blautia]MBU5679172.1 DMT family transporter [Blautia sp. MSJ-9]MCI7449902.1 DMT family transporter [Blautia sp.]